MQQALALTAAPHSDPAPAPRLVSLRKASAEFGIPLQTTRRLAQEGKIEAVVVSRRTLVVVDSLERFLAALPRVGR